MIYIDRNVEIGKTIIISNLFKAYVNEKLSYSQFIQILTTLDGLNPKAYEGFLDLERFGHEITSNNHTSCGPRNFEYETLIISGGFATEPGDWFSGFKLTDDGEKLYKYGIKPIKKDI
ncbi:hypothetical protein [Lentimicrobium sp. S6]|uniref:hypothetical protein n=1 Tax=Lentimicrobium sp. S6 TaxID=2735872 RepID=UPI0015577172|nr:hypothetical protein [Lentimicrobium sp. S6]NPD47223.1 hypothetical protein [Lentimicrobium sp. S6]